MGPSDKWRALGGAQLSRGCVTARGMCQPRPEGSTYTPLTLITHPKLMDSPSTPSALTLHAKTRFTLKITPITTPLSKKLNRVLATPRSGLIPKSMHYYVHSNNNTKFICMFIKCVCVYIHTHLFWALGARTFAYAFCIITTSIYMHVCMYVCVCVDR